ncbi:hypothetical protein [Sphingomonas radiodurans]|uniref:hypothetical protein n=1 Tax=Sphingomonas radiodurans TaxID=2890321 RepID=UPI001E50B5A9|nr:hypothetical protein [Sphingomonas radiodurans]WBH17499.1 hypothetical protein LLW23_05160 [Sphingomonas radiodurans]
MRSMVFPLVAALLALTGCGSTDGDGTSVSIDAGNGAARVDGGTGEVTLDTPLIKGSLKLPKFNLTADNFEIGGVHLFPGTKINTMNVNARGEGEGVVRVAFDSPATAATVRDWLRGEFEKQGTKVEVQGDTLRGTSDGENFLIDLKPAGERAKGTVTIG